MLDIISKWLSNNHNLKHILDKNEEISLYFVSESKIKDKATSAHPCFNIGCTEAHFANLLNCNPEGIVTVMSSGVFMFPSNLMGNDSDKVYFRFHNISL